MLEVNSSPGTEGIEEATRLNIAKSVITHFQEKQIDLKCQQNVVIEK